MFVLSSSQWKNFGLTSHISKYCQHNIFFIFYSGRNLHVTIEIYIILDTALHYWAVCDVQVNPQFAETEPQHHEYDSSH
jgi:hypothetical protein